MDCGVRKGRKIFSLNSHLIVEGEFKTMHLGMIEIKEIYTGGFVVNKIEELLNEYELGLSNVLPITCDKGSNMIKACEILREEKGISMII